MKNVNKDDNVESSSESNANPEVISPEKPEDQEQDVSVVSISRTVSGPLPSPEILQGYKDILSDAPERILQMAEKEQEADIYMRKKFDAYKSRGQKSALIIVLAAFFINFLMAWIGYPGWGAIISSTALVSIVGAFVSGNRSKG